MTSEQYEHGGDWLAAYDQPNPATVGMWDWVHQEELSERVDVSEETVTAIMVTHNAEEWLPAALESLERLVTQPDRIVVIDNGSRDATLAILQQAMQDRVVDIIYPGDKSWGFGRAVHEAIQREDASEIPTRWLWLLHDDIVIENTALDALLERAHVGDTELIGPKLLQMIRRGAAKTISELGVSISASGRRELSLDQGEIDQGQHETAPQLGVSSCGMLISRRLYDELGGFEPLIPIFRDGVELGWRANLAGHRVFTCPEARIMHRQMGRAGARKNFPHPTSTDRKYGLMLVSAHRRGISVFLTNIFLVLLTLGRALGFLIGKAPKRAGAEMRALGGFMLSGAKIRRIRKRIFQRKPAARDVNRTASLRPAWYAGIVNAWNGMFTWMSDFWEDMFGRAESDTTIDDLIGDDFTGSQKPRTRRPWLFPTVSIFVTLVICALISARGLFSLGHLTSTELAAAHDSIFTLADAYTAPIPGSPQDKSPSWLGAMLIASTLLFGQPEWVVSLLVIGAVPLSGLAAYQMFRHVSTDMRVRISASLLYSLLPAMLGTTTRGNLTVLVGSLVVPLLVSAALAWRRRGTQGLDSWRGAFTVGLYLAILGSFQPAIVLVGAIIGLAAAIRTKRMAHLIRFGVMLAVAVGLLASWIPTLIKHPGRFLTGADPTYAPVANSTIFALLIGRSQGVGLPPIWLSALFFGLIWVLAAVGLILRPSTTKAWALTAVLALSVVVVLPKLIVVVGPGELACRPSPVLWMLILFAALLAVASSGWDGLGSHLAKQSFGLSQAASVISLFATFAVALTSILWWVGWGTGPQLRRSDSFGLPASVQNTLVDGGTRTLAIDLSTAQPGWVLIENRGVRMGDADRGGAYGGDPTVRNIARETVANLAMGVISDETVKNLPVLGVGHVVLKNANAEQIAAVGSLPGLFPSGGDEQTKSWRVIGMKSRAHISMGEQEPVPIAAKGTTISGAAGNRQLVLSELRDPRWRATLNGKQLESLKDLTDFRQRFVVSEKGGKLTYEIQRSTWWAWLELAFLIFSIILAAPALRKMEARDPAQYARRAAVLEPEVTAAQPAVRGYAEHSTQETQVLRVERSKYGSRGRPE